jgi:mono/diheme cytochrome c family protein
MRKQTALLAAVLAAACSAGSKLPRSAHGEQVLEVRGAVKNGPFRLGRAELDALPRRKLRGVDPVTGRLATWEGTPLTALVVDRVELTKGADVVLVRTVDRRAVPVPLPLVRQLRPVLADRADGEPLPEPVVAWPTEEQRGLDTDPRARLWWARGVVALELVNGFSTLGRAMAVPAGAPEGARLGADLFAARCVACHRLRAAGGENGPDLTRLAGRMTEDAFRARLGGHPGWLERGPEPGEASAQQVWAFLRAVGAVAEGTAPPDEPPPEERSPGERGRSGRSSAYGPDEQDPDR